MTYYPWEATDGRCVVCDGPLSGRQEILCSARCRKARQRAAKLTREEFWEKLTGRDCARCGDAFDPKNPQQRFCSPVCADNAKRSDEAARWDAVCELDGCENNAGWDGAGRPRRYCSPAHKQQAYRLRKRAESPSESR
jgi:predicted nucleic acid-binding Zn ribbon protein